MKRILSIVLTLVAIMILAAGCGSKQTTPNTGSNPAPNTATNTEFKLGDLSDSKPLAVNKDKKEVQVLAEVNGKYFTEPTRHGVVAKTGSNGEKSVLRGLANEIDFYNALIEIGAKPGNNISLLETPEETVNNLLPFVLATSLKDMGVAPYQDGFLLSEVVFGTSATDQAALFRLMRKQNPKVNMVEELITRDPLKIPCLTDAYWAGFPAKDQKRQDAMLAWVKAKQTKLPYVDQLTPEERFKVEESNHRKTIDWGRTFRA